MNTKLKLALAGSLAVHTLMPPPQAVAKQQTTCEELPGYCSKVGGDAFVWVQVNSWTCTNFGWQFSEDCNCSL